VSAVTAAKADPKAVAGSIPALLTPFTAGGAGIDFSVLRQRLEWLERHGVDSVLVAGTTGDGQSLTVSERTELVREVKRHNGDLAVMAGTGFNALPDSIEASRAAIELGAGCVLVAPPSYFPCDDAGVVAYFDALLSQLGEDARVVIYHIPGYTGVPISLAAVRELRQRFGPAVAGLKDSGGKASYLEEAIRELPELMVYGSDGVAGQAFAGGAAGVISALANVVPADFHSIRAAAEEAADPPAEVTARLTELRRLSHEMPQRSALKRLSQIASGIPEAATRPPELELSPEQIASLDASPVVRELKA
jgi:4-hydroxy-tetrahydrodipicolinate synthase